jgi:hypothetical protein
MIYARASTNAPPLLRVADGSSSGSSYPCSRSHRAPPEIAGLRQRLKRRLAGECAARGAAIEGGRIVAAEVESRGR